MTNRKITYAVAGAVFLLSMLAPSGVQAKKTRLVAVSADVVEISGSLQSVKGFSWNQLFDFEEATIPGILSLGEFQRKTAVTTRLRLMETEGRAQVLSNPKIVTASGNQARITVGGRVPIPVVNNQGVGSQLEDYGILLNVLPTIIPERNNIIDVSVQLEVSTVDYSRTVVNAYNVGIKIKTSRRVFVSYRHNQRVPHLHSCRLVLHKMSHFVIRRICPFT